jgi:hypothetical protein
MPACRHPDIQKFDGFRCCLSCGEAIFDDVSQEEQTTNDKNTSNYQYKPLNYGLGQEIRLVVLHPGRESDDMTCDIIHVNLLDDPIYEAVSYTWASHMVSRKNDLRHGKLQITTDLPQKTWAQKNRLDRCHLYQSGKYHGKESSSEVDGYHLLERIASCSIPRL